MLPIIGNGEIAGLHIIGMPQERLASEELNALALIKQLECNQMHFNPPTIKKLQQIVQENNELFLEAWNAYFTR